jgi:hypothetical protein
VVPGDPARGELSPRIWIEGALENPLQNILPLLAMCVVVLLPVELSPSPPWVPPREWPNRYA